MEDFEARPSVVRWFIVGGLLGAGTALLLAPASGKRTRNRLATGLRDAKESASAMTGELALRARGLVDSASRIADSAVTFAGDVTAAARDAMGSVEREAERSARR